MGTSLVLFKNPQSWIVVLAPLIPFASFLFFGSLPIFFTSIVLILSTVLFIFSQRKLKLVVKSAKEDIHKSVHEGSTDQIEDVSASKQQNRSGINKQTSEEEEGGLCQIHDYIVNSPDVLSENECVDQLSTTEGSEVLDWPFRDNTDQNPDYSDDDGSIPDEDSLIEISLPGGHSVRHKEDQQPNKYSMQRKLPDFMSESIFQQRSLMELLAEFNEMNEEENLIEIDISMGSIKYSRFKIEA